MIRRPSRTALHSALSALSGGLRGVAMQRQQAEERAQRDILNQRNALRDALELAESGAAIATPEQLAAETPPPTVTLGEQRYVVPSLEERARRRAEAEEQARAQARQVQLQEAERVREAQNRRTYGALRVLEPQMAGEYNPAVDYASIIENRQQATAAGVRATELERDRAAKRAEARGWLSTQVPQMSQAERNRLGLAYSEIMARGDVDPEDARVALMEAERARINMETQQALAGQRDAAAARALAEAGIGPGTSDITALPGTTPAPAPFMPARPAAPVTPAQPAPAAPVTPATPARPRVGYTGADYDAALNALGPEATVDEVSNWLRINRPLNRTP